MTKREILDAILRGDMTVEEARRVRPLEVRVVMEEEGRLTDVHGEEVSYEQAARWQNDPKVVYIVLRPQDAITEPVDL